MRYDFEEDKKELSLDNMLVIQGLLNHDDIETIMPALITAYATTHNRIRQLNKLIPEITENTIKIADESENEYYHALETANAIFTPAKIKKGLEYTYFPSYALFLIKCCKDGTSKGYNKECVISRMMDWLCEFVRTNSIWMEYIKKDDSYGNIIKDNDNKIADYIKLVIKANSIKLEYDYKEQ
jgi:hypothetical protein